MNKNAIRDFAINARNKLRENVTNKLFELGIIENEIKKPLDSSTKDIEYFDIGLSDPISVAGEDIRKRAEIVSILENYSKDSSLKDAFNKLVEEVAYTWFNRLIAIRFMEVNDYLPSRIRVLSSEEGSKDPDILRFPFNADIEYSVIEVEQIRELQDKGDFEELYKLLLLKQSRELGEILPFLFNSNSNYLELLFPFSYSDSESVLNDLINSIPEEDFNLEDEGQIEIIGWLYQYYITHLNEQVYDGSLSKAKIPKELISAATTIYTPDWVVKYLVENSLGRLWINHLKINDPNLNEKELAEEFDWKYYLPENLTKDELKQLNNLINLNPEDIKFLDPSMGSGHILIYAFEVLLQIYEKEGYSRREATKLVLENNLFGLDIDRRATQLAYFALLMKARESNRRIFRNETSLNLSDFNLINSIDKSFLDIVETILSDESYQQLNRIIKELENSDTYGSITKTSSLDTELIEKELEIIQTSNLTLLNIEEIISKIKSIFKLYNLLSNKYNVIVTNPPYLGSTRFNSILDKYVKKNYPNVKKDLALVMFEHSIRDLANKNSYVGFLTTSSWTSLSSFSKLREQINNENQIVNLVDFGTELFEGKVGHNPAVAWITRKDKINSNILGIRLVDYNYSRRDEKESQFFNTNNYYFTDQNKFELIPDNPIAYWVSDALFDSFKNGIPLGKIADSKFGLKTANDNLYLKFWTEINYNQIKFNTQNIEESQHCNLKWYPYPKGGKYRKWYGNTIDVVNWKSNGQKIREFSKTNKSVGIPNNNFLFPLAITWSRISSGAAAFRLKNEGFIFSSSGPSLFPKEDNFLYIFALVNSNVTFELLKILTPTISFQSGDIAKLPVIINEDYRDKIEELAKENIELSKEDWDSFEFSWDFNNHPLIRQTKTIKEAFELWEKEAEERFNKLKANEEELNEIFIKIYGLEDELTPEVEDKYVSVRKADREREIRSLISYAVGVLFGRYSLDKEGLVLAGGDIDYSNYQTIIPDEDNIIPILDEEYFEDDIVGLFLNFIKTVYGEEKFEENLSYIADSLGGRNKTSREIIRDYFKKDFFKDHLKNYQKRPIYWLYSSGRQGGVKALIYMHRYNKETTAKLKADYLTRLLRTYINEIDRLEKINAISTNKREVAQNKKQITKLQKQLKEAQEFNDKISHLADLSIDIDLDDGVKVNYQKVQTDENGKNLKILQTI